MADKVLSDVVELANIDIKNAHALSSSSSFCAAYNDNDNTFSPPTVRAQMWHLTDTMGAYKTSTVLDMLHGNELETELLFRNPYRRLLAARALFPPSESPRFTHLESLLLTVLGTAELYKQVRRSGKSWISNVISD